MRTCCLGHAFRNLPLFDKGLDSLAASRSIYPGVEVLWFGGSQVVLHTTPHTTARIAGRLGFNHNSNLRNPFNDFHALQFACHRRVSGP